MMSPFLARTIRTLSIGQFVFLLSMAAMILAVVVVLLMSTFVERRAIGDLAQEEARQTSELIFQSLYTAMRKGWTKDEIGEIVDRLNESQPGTDIRVFRGAPVIAQYGDIPGEAPVRDTDQLVTQAFRTAEPVLETGEDHIRYVYPVLVRDECQTCHEAAIGQVNGVVDISYPITDLKVSVGFVIKSVIAYFTLILTTLFLALYFKLRVFVAQPISRFAGVIEEIISHTDLNRRVGPGTHLREVNSLSQHFNRLLGTIQEYQDKLEHFSQRDPLTNLYNRRKFEDFLRMEVARGQRHGHPFSLIMMDLDDFKSINDTYGHPVGDLALKELATVLDRRMRRTDIIARLGGDEFAVLMPQTTAEQGAIAAENLRKAVAETSLRLPVGATRVGASFGLVTFPDNGATVEKLSIAMDVAMYKAKRLGKNRVATLDSGEEDAAMAVFQKGRMLKDALADDAIEPVFQAICTSADTRPFALEVLARVRTPEGLKTAGEFIEAADELGLTRDIDERIFEKGLATLAAQRDPDLKMFFNLSGRSLAAAEWMHEVPARARAAGVAAERIVFEITEREALPHFDKLVKIIDAMRGHGVRFALDDFGSGFSSFVYLKFLDVDYIKIEGSLIRNLRRDPRDRVMVSHIHQMAKEFGLSTIAEFVEDAETLALLQEMGIDYVQGWHLGAPGPI
ncbi:putative signal transduction protein [Caenispirillum salinarum AK4]|uniref:Putative signal transduction protein n=1 Tax=Caenispirillum salinarum AK4 TaxID=1238182 RepID=K9GQJ4_9PROT|nr:EAL domain-containing protein [Caenispirillum salinarum]EKV27009.1 putative signal transduction protein [Caenispirillum salinarum AK4]